MMRSILFIACLLAGSVITWAGVSKPTQGNKWGFLGDDDDALRQNVAESKQVLLVCVYATELKNVKPPFADVVFKATVVEVLKGRHALGDKITIGFDTDSLPVEEKARVKFIEETSKANLGCLKLAFLTQEKTTDYGTEFLFVPDYRADMLEFVRKNVPKK